MVVQEGIPLAVERLPTALQVSLTDSLVLVAHQCHDVAQEVSTGWKNK